MGNGFLYAQKGGGNKVATGEYVFEKSNSKTTYDTLTVSISCDFEPTHILFYCYSKNGESQISYPFYHILFNINDNTWLEEVDSKNSLTNETPIITVKDIYAYGYQKAPSYDISSKTLDMGLYGTINTEDYGLNPYFTARRQFCNRFTYKWIAWKD